MAPSLRALKAVLFADLEGYSFRVGRDEDSTLDFMERCFALFREACDAHRASVVKTTGDGVVVQFDSATDAVAYAVETSVRIEAMQADWPDKARFRMGIHVGEIQLGESDIYGHAVNVAARLEQLAQPGDIYVSQDIYRHAARSGDFVFEAVGTHSLKNIPERIPVYRVIGIDRTDGAELQAERLQISTVDGLTVWGRNHPVAHLRSKQVRGILGYLALSHQLREVRERLAAVIWPDRPAVAARQALARTLRSARNAIEPVVAGAFIDEGEYIGLTPGLIDIDIVRYHRNVGLGRIDDLLLERSDWPDLLLSGLEDVSSLFRSWLEVSRYNWRRRMAEALEDSFARFQSDDSGARRAALALLMLEPSHEPAARVLIRYFLATGNRARALEEFQRFRDRLKREHGIEPSPETSALVEDVARHISMEVAPPARGPRLRLPRIAVGAFSFDEDWSDVDYLAQGFRSEVMTNLARFRDWVVLEADGTAPSPPNGRGPDYILTAQWSSVPTGQRIFVLFARAGSGRVVWSEQFDVSLDDWLGIQRRLVRRTAAHLEVYLSSDRLAAAISGDVEPSIYDEWLRGEHLLTQWHADAEDRAAEIFGALIVQRPNFAPAYASLAGIYNVRHLIRPGLPRDADDEGHALPLAQRAVELDPLDARNQHAVAWSAAMAREYEQASVHFELALSLNRSSLRSLLSCAQGLAFIGQPERAKDLLDEVAQLAPMYLDYQWCYVASTLYFIGDFEAAVSAAVRGGSATFDNAGWRAVSLARLGRLEEARAAFAEQVKWVGDGWTGVGRPGPDDVADWFLSSFPIRRKLDYDALRRALNSLVET